MKSFFLSASILAVGASGTWAGGIERSSQGVGILFEDGGYLQLSFGAVIPTVSGSVAPGPVPSGDMAPTYLQFGLAVKQDFSEKLSVALILDQPFGADVAYPGTFVPLGSYPFAASTAEINSLALTAVGKYALSERASVIAGLRVQTMSGVASIPVVGAPGPGYTLDVSGTTGVGYLVGASYEIPDIALRVALTYNSEITHNMTGIETGGGGGGPSDFDITTPQSVNLEFQTGVAADTLVFGSIRWVNWSAFDISPTNYPLNPLVDYDNDATTYTLGVGRRFSDTFSGSIALGYEAANGGVASNLGPTDGFFSVQVGGQYTMGDIEISGGVRYVMIGDATTSIGANFTDNSAIGVGMQIGYSF